jgi:protein ImuA
MATSASLPVLKALRERIQRLEGGAARPRTVLPFGIKAIDQHLPEGGLALGALHEVAGGGNGAIDGAAARVIYVDTGDETSVLACFEEGLRHGGLGAVVAEVARLSITASRRHQLAAEGSGALGIAIRRWRRQTEATDFGQPTAAATRWRVSALPSTPLPIPGVGRAAGSWS